MSLEEWTKLGVAIITFAGVLGLVGKGLSMFWQWRFGNDIRTALAEIKTEIKEARAEAQRDNADTRELVAEHLRWHGSPRGAPARPAPGSQNSSGRRRA